ncbi:MAG TPA: Ig-like domain-containing protein [Symbiobacteriaceae bacterium]|jgi:hypothetical protein
MNRTVKIGIAAVLAVALATTAVWFGYVRKPAGPRALPFGQAAPAEATLTPVTADVAGVDVATAFRLTAVKAIAAETVKKHLTVQPAVELRVEKADLLGKEYKITPAGSLEAGRIYNFRLATDPLSRPYQWSFQTKANFRILGTLPRNQATGVPVNTGIEINFSHDSYADLNDSFTTSPAAEGRFERHKKTVAFVPKNPLQPGTVYTVTVKKGLGQQDASGKLDTDYVFAFETQPEGSAQRQSWFYVPQDVQEFPAADAPYFQVGYDKNTSGVQAGVKVWRYGDAGAFIGALLKVEDVPWWANYNRSKYAEEPTGLNQVASFTSELKTFTNMGGTYLMFPDKLPGGYYLAQIAMGDQTRQVRFQVTDLASFVAVTSTKTLVWLHDLSTKAPVKNATVTFAGASAVSDADGVAALTTPPEVASPKSKSGTFLIAKTAGAELKEAVVDAYPSWYYESGAQTGAHYWRYLYADRSLYKPDDVVNIWGVLRPRDATVQPADKVTVQATRWDIRGFADQPIPLAKADLPVQDGIYTGALKLTGFRPGNYTLEVRLGDEVVSSTWFEVQTYTKPAYTVTVTPDRNALFADDTMQFQVQAAFFEGTPVPNLKLNYSASIGKESGGEVITGQDGTGTITYQPTGYSNGYGWPQTTYLHVHATTPEAGEITAQTTVAVFPSTIAMDAETKAVDNGTGKNEGTVTVSLRKVRLDQINAGLPIWPDSNWKGDPADGLTVSGSVIEQNWIRDDDGEEYDFINKVVVKKYRYRPDPRTVLTFTGVTDSGGQLVRRFPIQPDKQYQIDLTTRDTKGHYLSRQAYLYGGQYHNPDAYHYWYLDSGTANQWQWRLDEDATFVIKENQAPVPDRPRSFLFLTARFGLQSFAVQDKAAFTTRLKPEDLPNTNVAGVYFDGRQYHYTGSRSLAVDPNEKALKVTVTTDKADYRPGDTVTLSVQTLGRRGKPASARVNLNLVDEALYALRDQSVNLLNGLYGTNQVPSGILQWNVSHKVPLPGSGAEKGGDGGGVRADFRDAVFFQTVTTDAGGKATASFKVPDNLTSWRLTYHAVNTGTMEAASGTQPVLVKLPFFVDLVLGGSYLSGDKPVVALRSYGTALKSGDQVQYTVKLEGPKAEVQEWQKSGKAFTPVTLPLPKLPAGTYKLTARSTAPGGLTDAIAQSFTVVDSYLTQNKVDFYLLGTETKVAGAAAGLTTLTFTDYDRSRYLQLLGQLRWQWGNRVEQKLSRTVAGALLKQYFDQQDRWAEAGLDLMAYQTATGSVAILPYADGELKLSALAADLAAGRLDRAGLTKYFQTVLDDPKSGREEVTLALYGLAAVDEPVLPAILQMLKLKDLKLNERLYLALAAARAGALEDARPVYYGILQEFGEQLGADARIKSGTDQDEIIQATALTAALAGKLGEGQAAALAGYLTGNGTKEVLVSLEEALAAQTALPNLAVGGPAAVTYVLDGKEERRELKPGGSFSLALAPESLATVQFKDVQGRVGLTATYPAPLKATGVKPTPGFSVTTSDQVIATGKGGGYKVGDLVRYTVNYAIPDTAPGGNYEVSVYLPSGLLLVPQPWTWGVKSDRVTWPLEVNGQKLTFYAYKQGWPIQFYARVVAPGDYAAEQATLQHQRSGTIYALSPRWWARVAE